MSSMDITVHASDSVISGAVDMVTLFSEQARPAGINIYLRRSVSRRTKLLANILAS